MVGAGSLFGGTRERIHNEGYEEEEDQEVEQHSKRRANPVEHEEDPESHENIECAVLRCRTARGTRFTPSQIHIGTG